MAAFVPYDWVLPQGGGGETNMADLKSFNASPIVNSSTRRARMIGGAATAAATAVLALMVVLDFNGCSKSNNKNAQAQPSVQNTGNPAVAQSQPIDQLEKKVEAVIEKKKAIKHASTATYKNSTYGISFRYPKTYTMLTPEKDSKESAWPDPVAMNFTEPGGETLTTLVLPGTRASSYFKASVNKGVTVEQCSKFATTPEPTEAVTNPPVDTEDDSIVPVKTNILGVEFAKAESVTEQSEARYYHHFENGACYEFALGVEDAPGTTKPVDHLQVFDKLERIMTTVKIKSDPVPVVATSEPAAPMAPASNPQQ
ncbi:MAG TPA: hypothetical protein VFQ41_21395 [Candidatus Angelobacter sp.]|nr:hypothetical protein [Candidatus Angelobacter sp.]